MSKKDPSEFLQKTIETLAKRAAQTCSNPGCRRPTSGPHSDKDKSVIVGKAAHIKGRKAGSARYDAAMSDEQRRDITNGIWLCGVCHDAVDRDETKYTVEVLHKWKEEHENVVTKTMLSSLGLRRDNPIAATATVDVLEDKNIKSSIEAWGKGDIENATRFAKDAYFSGSGQIKLQAIINMILLSHDQIDRASYYVSLCEEGITLAKTIGDLSSAAVIKAQEVYFLQNRAFINSLAVYQEIKTREAIGFPNKTDTQIKRLTTDIENDAKRVDALVIEAQEDAIKSNSYSSLAHVKMTVGNAIGLTYFLNHQMGGDTGSTEQLTIRFITEAKEIYEKLGDKEGIGNSLHNLANNLRFFGDTERAKVYAAQALQIAKEIGYKELEAKASELLNARLEEKSTSH